MKEENKYAREVEETMKELLEKNNFGVLDCEEERIRELNTEKSIAREDAKEETAKEMLKDGVDEKSISKYTGFSLEKIKKLKAMLL